mgnify:CR=1 FL=1
MWGGGDPPPANRQKGVNVANILYLLLNEKDIQYVGAVQKNSKIRLLP